MGRKALSSSEASARLRMLVYCLRILHTLRRVLECFEIGAGEARTFFSGLDFRFASLSHARLFSTEPHTRIRQHGSKRAPLDTNYRSLWK